MTWRRIFRRAFLIWWRQRPRARRRLQERIRRLEIETGIVQRPAWPEPGSIIEVAMDRKRRLSEAMFYGIDPRLALTVAKSESDFVRGFRDGMAELLDREADREG